MQRTMWRQLAAVLAVVLVLPAGCSSGSGKQETTGVDAEKKDYDAGYREAYRYGREGLGGRPDFEGKSEAYKKGWAAGHKAGLAEFERNPPRRKHDKPDG